MSEKTIANVSNTASTGTSAANGAPDRTLPAKEDNPSSSAKEASDSIIICSVLFLDIVGYSKVSGREQITLKKDFNNILSEAIRGIPPDGIIILDTGDGAALNFLVDIEAALRVAIYLRDELLKKGAQMNPPLLVRMGINLGPGHLVKDINGRANIVGDVINVAQRVMGFSNAGQILVSRSYFDSVSRLSPEYEGMFQHFGSNADKHMREHEVYVVARNNELELAASLAGLEQKAASFNPDSLSSGDAQSVEAVREPSWIASLFKAILGFFKFLFMKVFNFFVSLFMAAFGIVKLAMVAAVIVVVVTLVIKFAPSMDAVESGLSTLWGTASKQVDKGLQAAGIDPNANQDAKPKQGIDPKSQGTAQKKAKAKNIATTEAAKDNVTTPEEK